MLRTRTLVTPILMLAAVGCRDVPFTPSQLSTSQTPAISQHGAETLQVTVTDLGVPPGASGVTWVTLNDRGEAAIQAQGPPGRAFLWLPRGGFLDLGTLGGSAAAPLEGSGAVNNRGDVVGISADASGHGPLAFLWTRGDGMTELLPDVPPPNDARSINDNGDIAGNIGPMNFAQTNGYYWTKKDGITFVGSLPGGMGSFVWGLNNRGQVVGAALATPPAPGGREVNLFRWSKQDGLQDLGFINWIGVGAPGVGPFDINDRGQIAGGRVHPSDEPPDPDGPCAGFGPFFCSFTAFLWTPGEGFVDLLPQGAIHSRATNLNNAGEVVGLFRYADSPSRMRAFFWSKSTGFVELPGLGGPTRATGINNNGTVAGHSFNPADGRMHALLWTVRRS